MHRNRSCGMDPDTKSASSPEVVIPVGYVQHQSHIHRIVITIPGKCIARTKVTHEILVRFNWSRLSLFLTVIAIILASATLVALLLS